MLTSIVKRKFFFPTFLFFICIFLLSKPHSTEAACYNFFSTNVPDQSTYNIDVSNGSVSKNLSLFWQNPVTILQRVTFRAENRLDPCTLFFKENTRIGESFVVGNSTVETFGFYPQIGNVQSDKYLLNEFWASPFLDIPPQLRISNEDAVINEIDRTRTLTTRITNGLGQTLDVLAAATNCVHVSGNGPRKVVFTRGHTWNSSVSEFLYSASEAIDKGFKSIDPFKTYIDQFSFYVDLKKVNEADLPINVDLSTMKFVYDSPADVSIKNQSSCGKDGFEYILLTNDKKLYPAFTIAKPIDYSGVSVATNVISLQPLYSLFCNLDMNIPCGFEDTVIHETAHAIANLGDEYTLGYTTSVRPIVDNNCVHDPNEGFRSSIDNYVYAGFTRDIDGNPNYNRGCSSFSDGSGPLYRPSAKSIMNSRSFYVKKFNVISCGYIISAIKGEPIDKNHAQAHWPECATLDTVKDGTFIKNPVPKVDSVLKYNKINFNVDETSFVKIFNGFFKNITSTLVAAVGATNYINLTAGETISVSGSNFSATNNSAQLSKVSNVSEIYEVLGIPSEDLSTISFDVPASTPAGEYYLKVGAFNSEWGPVVSRLVVSSGGPVVVSSLVINANPTTISRGQSSTISWSEPTAISCTASGSWSGSKANSGTYTVTPLNSSSYTLTCTYPNDGSRNGVYTATKSETVTVNVNQPPSSMEVTAPVIHTFTATPSSITIGQSTVLSWTVLGASTATTRCTASGAWTGLKQIRGTQSVTPTDDSTYTLTCNDTVGGTSQPVSVNVIVAPLSADYFSSIAPSDLKVEITSVSKQLRLTWVNNFPSNTASGNQVESFEIERRDKVDPNFKLISSVAPSTLSYVDIGLLNTHEYIYRVRAKLTTGDYSDYSDTVSLITQPPTPLVAKALIKGSVDLSWADNSSIETGYIVQQAPAGSIMYKDVVVLPANKTSYRVEKLAPSTTYRYRIQAVLPGYTSPYIYTPVVNIKTLAAPAKPVVKAVATSPWTINITWSDVDASVVTGYTLVQVTPYKVTLLSNSDVTSYQVNNLTPSTKYCYTVSSSINPVNNSVPSTQVCATTQASSVVTQPSPTVGFLTPSKNITPGQTARLIWASNNATFCTASGAWTGNKASSGTEFVVARQNLIYTLTCTGAGGTSQPISIDISTTLSATPTTIVTPDPEPASLTTTPRPVVSFTTPSKNLLPDQKATLVWSSTYATSCTASGAWTGNKSTSGTELVSVSPTLRYTLTCTGEGGVSSPISIDSYVTLGSPINPPVLATSTSPTATTPTITIVSPKNENLKIGVKHQIKWKDSREKGKGLSPVYSISITGSNGKTVIADNLTTSKWCDEIQCYYDWTPTTPSTNNQISIYDTANDPSASLVGRSTTFNIEAGSPVSQNSVNVKASIWESFMQNFSW